MLTAKQYARKHGYSDNGSRIRQLCIAGRIKGAVKVGRDWLIPESAKMPVRKSQRK